MKLLYFSWIRERLDMGEEEISLPGHIKTLADLFDWLKARGEEFESVFQHEGIVRVAIDQEHIDEPSTLIVEAKEIAFFPPMTGG